MDYRRDIEFGYFPVPNADDYPTLVEQAQIADEAGLDLIGIQDHPYQHQFLDTFSLITDLAARTNRVRFFPDVGQPPASAPLDHCQGGRVDRQNERWAVRARSRGRRVLGRDRGHGRSRKGPSEAVESVAEAIEVIRLLWSGERNLRFEGRHYRLKGIHSGPVPAHDIFEHPSATGAALRRALFEDRHPAWPLDCVRRSPSPASRGSLGAAPGSRALGIHRRRSPRAMICGRGCAPDRGPHSVADDA